MWKGSLTTFHAPFFDCSVLSSAQNQKPRDPSARTQNSPIGEGTYSVRCDRETSATGAPGGARSIRYPASRALASLWVTAALYRAKIPVASEPDAEASRRLATRTCDASLSKPLGAIVVRQVSGTVCADDRRASRKKPRRLRGRRNTGCTSDI